MVGIGIFCVCFLDVSNLFKDIYLEMLEVRFGVVFKIYIFFFVVLFWLYIIYLIVRKERLFGLS